MKKVLMLFLVGLFSISLTSVSFAQQRTLKANGFGSETIVDYNVTYVDPQLVTLSGLSAYGLYSLDCAPAMASYSDVYVTVWANGTAYTGRFGGYYGDAISFPKLKGTQYTDGTYKIKYQISTHDYAIQNGTCYFK